MKVVDILATASSNMFRSKLRTSLTVVAIFIGAFTLTLTNGLGAGISRYIDQQVNALGAKDVLIIQGSSESTGLPSDQPKKYDPNRQTTSVATEGNRTITVLTDTDLKKIRQTNNILSADLYQSASIDYVAGPNTEKYVASIDRYLSGENFPLDAGRFPDNNSKTLEVLIPSSYVKVLGFNDAAGAVNQPMRLSLTNALGKPAETSATIVGVLQKSLISGSSIYTNTVAAEQLLTAQRFGLPAGSPSNAAAIIARFDSNLSDKQLTQLKDKLKSDGYAAQTVEDQIGTFKSVINGIIAVLNGFAVIALLAASFGIINTLLMSVQERTKEIGLMKAMGMGSGRIFLLFSFEAVLLGFWGSFIGSLVAIGAGQIINRIVITSFLKDLVGLKLLTFTPASVAVIIGIVMLIAFIAGTLPAIRAARQSPIDSLRYE